MYKGLHAWIMWESYVFTKVIVEYSNVEVLHALVLSGLCISLKLL